VTLSRPGSPRGRRRYLIHLICRSISDTVSFCFIFWYLRWRRI
jgi:hypothetical protein